MTYTSALGKWHTVKDGTPCVDVFCDGEVIRIVDTRSRPQDLGVVEIPAWSLEELISTLQGLAYDVHQQRQSRIPGQSE